MRSDYDTKGYVCPFCQRRYTTLEAMSLIDMATQSFKCEDCEHELVDDDQSVEIKTSQKRLNRLNHQVDQIVKSLKAVDEVQIPPQTFISALANALPTELNLAGLGPQSMGASLGADGMAGGVGNQFPVTVMGGMGFNQKIQVDFSGDDHTQDEEAKRAELAKQNALPVWHTTSTVSNSYLGLYEERAKSELADQSNQPKQPEDDSKKAVSGEEPAASAIEAYFEALRKKQLEDQAKEAADVADDDDDDDEDEFEDVMGEKEGEKNKGTAYNDGIEMNIANNGGITTTTATTTDSSRAVSPEYGEPARNGEKNETNERKTVDNKNSTGGTVVQDEEDEEENFSDEFEDV